ELRGCPWLRIGRRLDGSLTRECQFARRMNFRHLQCERFCSRGEGVAQVEVGPEQNEGSKGRDRPNGNLKTAARQRNCLTTPVRRKILDRLRLGATNGFVQISPD